MPMTTSTAVERYQPVMSEAEQTTLLGLLAGYRGYTRDAYTLDLRQFTSWCWQRHHRLFEVRRVDIECFARELEDRGRSRATVARRLCTIVGFYRYAEEEGVIEHSPAVTHPSTESRLRVPCRPLGPGSPPQRRRWNRRARQGASPSFDSGSTRLPALRVDTPYLGNLGVLSLIGRSPASNAAACTGPLVGGAVAPTVADGPVAAAKVTANPEALTTDIAPRQTVSLRQDPTPRAWS